MIGLLQAYVTLVHAAEESKYEILKTRVVGLSSQVSTQYSEALTPKELNELRVSVAQLGYDDVLDAIAALELPVGEVQLLGMITPGQPLLDTEENWEAPARILVDRLVEIAPRHTSRWIQREEMGSRGSIAFIDRFAKTLPDVAWDETKRHYAEYWERSDGGKVYPIPELANRVFSAYEELDDSPGRKFLLDGTYAKAPYAKQLQIDAIMGMLRAADSADDLVSFLDWRLAAGKNLPEEIKRHRFRVDPGTWRITALGLSLLAKESPKKAIEWAFANDDALDFDWHYAIYGGWVEFWAERPEDLQAYLDRRVDAFGWLVEHVDPESSTIHNAYWNWRSDNLRESKEWLNMASDNKRHKAVKELLEAKESIWPSKQ